LVLDIERPAVVVPSTATASAAARDEIWVAILKHGRSLRNVGIPLLLLLLYFNDNLVGFLQMMDVNRMLLYNWDDRMQGSIGRIGSFEKGCESEKVNYYYYNSSLGSSCQFLLLLLLLLRMCLGKSKNPPFFTEKQKEYFSVRFSSSSSWAVA